MHAGLAQIAAAAEPSVHGNRPPILDLGPLTPAELRKRFRGGEVEADACEALLGWALGVRGALDLAIAEGLCALKRGDRLARLAMHLDDYGREVLDLGETTTRNLVKLGAAVRDRLVLRAAILERRIRMRSAQLIVPVAVGADEARWVERAASSTVRELELAVRRARAGLPEDEDEGWMRIRTHLPPLEQQVVDVALELAGRHLPHATKFQRLEAMAQEFLAEFPGDGDEDGDSDSGADGDPTRPLGPEFRACDRHANARRAALEEETERWSHLPAIPLAPIPDVRFDDSMTAQEVDLRLRDLAAQRSRLNDVIGWCGLVLKRSGIPALLGFTSFRHYVEERFGVPARAVEQRVALEARLWASPALREAKRHGLGYEKLRALTRLPERDVAAWIPRAKALTCIALRRRVDGERERQMRAARTFSASMPRRVAVLLAAVVRTVRARAKCVVPIATCLAELAFHFVSTWKHDLRPVRSRAQQVLERDLGKCQVPGCSRAAAEAHHVEFRSRGGSDDPENQVGLCRFHHHRCIHAGTLVVFGLAPDALQWFVNGEPFRCGADPADA